MGKKTKDEKKGGRKGGKIIRTVLSGLLTVLLVAIIFLGNTILKTNSRLINNLLGNAHKTINQSNAKAAGLDLEYYKSDYSKNDIGAAQKALAVRISEEGLVLLENRDGFLPVAAGTVFSFVSANSVKVSADGGILARGRNLKELFEDRNLGVNATLWDFYAKGKGKGYGLASGSLSFGDREDFRINEAPLSLILNDSKIVDSMKGTVPVYVLRRVAGEGRDMPRSMYNHADKQEDKVKSYLELDSTELEIIKYLNDHFNNVILVVNANAALELAWIKDYPNIRSVILAPAGLTALADVLIGTVNPSGCTVDTFAVNALASPAARNFGDYRYYDQNNNATKYNYISYAEGIYVGYKYYETRYEDVVLGQGNAGNFDYEKEVCYPFGYGLSYTTFKWGNMRTSWNGATCTVTLDVSNTGAVAGKDVVQVYVQSPYTDYDRQHRVEKPAVQLVGYVKTPELKPGETRRVTVTFEEEQLKAYDYSGARTYILDAGEYYITAGQNAHDAVNNVLAYKGTAQAGKMTGEGNKGMISVYIPRNTEVDTITYAKDSYSGVVITNRFDEAAGDIVYLTRNDWGGTWPTPDGVAYNEISTWGNEINGKDENGNPVSYVYGKQIGNDLIAKLDAYDSLNPVDPDSIKADIVYGRDNGLALIDMRGLDFDDPLWDDLLDELTASDYYEMIAQSGYGLSFLKSINKPFNVDTDGAGFILYGGTGATYPNVMTLAQTWNLDVASEFGRMIGNELVIGGADGWYAPAMNIHRTPFSGRNGEYYSEDAFLSGAVASRSVYGAASKGVYTYIKHLAFNDQENHRGDRDGEFSLATWMNEQAAREIYLLPFEMCMKAGDVELNYVRKKADGSYENASRQIRANQAVMTAFNRIGYTWTGGSYPLITGILRNEWAFNGFILTDNANTGIFMDGYQMIESGADGKLTYLPESARFDFDRNDPATYYYGRKAMHRMLYTIANSKAMNNAMPGSIFVNAMSLSDKVILGINIICPLLILLMVYLTIRRFRKNAVVQEKERQEE